MRSLLILKMNFKKIAKYSGIFIILVSLIYEMNREQIDFDKSFFSINVGMFLFLFSVLFKKTYFLIVFFTSWLTYIILSIYFKNNFSVNQFIFIFLTFSIIFKYLLKNK